MTTDKSTDDVDGASVRSYPLPLPSIMPLFVLRTNVKVYPLTGASIILQWLIPIRSLMSVRLYPSSPR
jgi:hypothetical protein